MNLKLRELNRAIARALAIGSVAVVAMPVFAQDAEEETRIDTVTVTGSRVKRVDAETSQPVFTMSREDIKAQGLTSIGDVNSMQMQADQAGETLMTGGDADPAAVLTAVQKADLAFRMMMQMRNKVMQVYQEVKDIRI